MQVELVKTGHLGKEAGMPLVMEPNTTDVDLVDWAGASRAQIEEQLLSYGAILFRGFKVSSVSEFERFCEAVCPQLYGDYGDLPRESQAKKIYGATPYPPEKVILFHNESSHMNRWPMKQFFHCVVVAAKGGETPLVDCRKIWQQLDPEVRETFRQKGLMYVRNFVEGFDASWQQFFHTTDRVEVERQCRESSTEYEWLDENDLRIKQRTAAVATHPKTGETVFFNQVQLHHGACLEPDVREAFSLLFEEDRWPRNVFYGDGSPIENSLIEEICRLYWDQAVSFLWQEGDVVMVDNMLVAHARKSYEGDRKIVVAMGEMMDAETSGE